MPSARAFALILVLACGPALAAAGKVPSFADRQWAAARDFYNDEMVAGRCPIGFAKTEGGCSAPSHERKWAVGRPLPQSAIRFDLPHALVARLGKPPAGYRYLRVGGDVLLVSNSTKLVADGITDLGRR